MAPRRFFLLFLFCLPSCQSKCTNIPPIAVPITDVVLESGNSIRGVLVTAGSPPQNLSFIPQLYLNNTWVYNESTPLCPKDKTDLKCNTYRGGLYNPDNSSTARAVADVYAAGASSSDTDRTVGLHIWDSSWSLDDLGVGNITLDDYPIGMPGFDFGTQFHPQGALGLGQNSTLLSTLKDAGHISSRSYGYWWGEDGATLNAQTDGSLILGGYDAAKTQGPNITIPIKTPSLDCVSGMYLPIADIAMRFPNGTRSSIIAPAALLPTCLHIDFTAMLAFAYKPYYQRFEANAQSYFHSQSLGVDWWNPLYDPSSVYQGGVGVVLDGGLELTIPNELLVVPQKIIDDSGKVQINSTFSAILLQPTLGGNDAADTPMVGKQFFSSTYLFVDHDAGTFTVWQANRTSDTRLVSGGGDCNATEAQEAPPSSSSTGSSAGATDPPQTVSEADQNNGTLPTSTIVGIAVGAAGSLIVIAIIIFMCFVRRKKRKQRSEKSLLAHDGTRDGYKSPPHSNDYARHELHNVATSELDAAKVARELDGASQARELDAERDARELDGVESKHGHAGYKSHHSTHQVYELGTRSP